MKNVMVKAWEIAREGVKKFGGKVKEYFAEALKMAWAIVKSEAGYIVIEIAEGSRKNKSYVAEIVGLDSRYGFKRNFVTEDHDTDRIKVAKLEEGKVYEIQESGDREYAKVVNGEIVNISKKEVTEAVRTDVDDLQERIESYLVDTYKKNEQMYEPKFGTLEVFVKMQLQRIDFENLSDDQKETFNNNLTAQGY